MLADRLRLNRSQWVWVAGWGQSVGCQVELVLTGRVAPHVAFECVDAVVVDKAVGPGFLVQVAGIGMR